MHSAQWLFADETLQTLDTQSEVAECEGSLVCEAPIAQPRDIFLARMIWAVDDPQILTSPALHGGLSKAAPTSKNEIERFDDHAFPASARKLEPPVGAGFHAGEISHVHELVRCCPQDLLVLPAKAMRPDGKLLVVEGVLPGGMERTEEEYQQLFQRAGFRLTRIVPTKTWVSVIEGGS